MLDDVIAWVTDPAHLLFVEGVALLVVWLVVAVLLRTEYETGELEPRPVAFMLVIAGTAAFTLQVVTAIFPALSEYAVVRDNLWLLQLAAGALRGAAFVLLLAYIIYRYNERKHHAR